MWQSGVKCDIRAAGNPPCRAGGGGNVEAEVLDGLLTNEGKQSSVRGRMEIQQQAQRRQPDFCLVFLNRFNNNPGVFVNSGISLLSN